MTVTRKIHDVGARAQRFLPSQKRWLTANLSSVLLVGLALYVVWFAGAKKLRRSGVDVGVFSVIDQVFLVLVSVAGVWTLVLLVLRRRYTWPLTVFFAFIAWGYIRGAGGSDWVVLWLVDVSVVSIAFFAFDTARHNLSRVAVSFPTVFLGVSVVYAVFFAELAFRRDWFSDFLGELPYGLFMGIAGHHNQFGPVMAFGLLVILAQRRSSWPLRIVAVLFGVGLLWSGSDGSLVAFLVGAAAMFVAQDVFARGSGRIPWRSILVGVAGVVFAIIVAVVVLSRGIEQFTSGRNNIWQGFLEPAFAAGFFGLGSHPQFIRRYPELFDETATAFTDPHNTLLMLQLTTGYIGLALYMAFWVAVAMALWKRKNTVYRTLAIGISVFLLTHGLIESHIFGGLENTDMFYALLIGLLIKDPPPEPLASAAERSHAPA